MRVLALALVLVPLFTACRPGEVDEDADGSPADVDCDDTNASVHPGAAEACNGVDDDCDGEIDDVDATVGGTFFADGDGDGLGAGDGIVACEAPEGHVADGGDCDDANPQIYPGAPEADCTDPVDYNCDGSVGFADGDGDGTPACEDCDDANAAVNPGAVESCNGDDDDCDGETDEAGATGEATWYADADLDGFGAADAMTSACEAPSGHVANADDCDDAAAEVNPGATERCNGDDDDCDGETDEPGAQGERAWYADVDTDGFGAGDALAACEAPSGYVGNADDCDDTLIAVNPDADEVCNDDDDDCDGQTDESALDAPTWYGDADADGYGGSAFRLVQCAQPSGYVANADDCDDLLAAVYPGAVERCNGDDDDCDGVIDLDAVDRATFYADADFDTYGNAAATVLACEKPDGYVDRAGDCDDARAVRNPGASEVCDGLDNNCDNALPANEADADNDGVRICAGDCNDASASVKPGAPERCNNVDDDCDGPIDEDAIDRRAWYVDADNDGYGIPGGTVLACSKPPNRSANDDDCDDTADDVNPGAARVCSDVDHDCDGIVDGDLDEDGDISDACGGFDCDDTDPEITAEDCIRPSCKAYRQAGITQSGVYTIDPDGTNTGAAPFDVRCDMTTDGGGWTLTYWVSASHFDAYYANNRVAQNTAPTARNVQRDVWNVPSALTHSETLFFCTDNDNTPSYWRYNTADPQMWITSLSTSYDYRNNFPTNATNSGNAGGCMATHKAETSYGFIVIDKSTSCGSCQSMLWGNYHYPSGRAECNSTSNTYGTHPSAWDNRTIGYPLCNLKQTSTGEFWIGVR